MTGIHGGLRQRLIKDSLFYLVRSTLSDMGWLTSSDIRSDVECIAERVDNDDEIRPNIVAVSVDDITTDDFELGTQFAERTWTFYVDVYAESEALGLHLSGDIEAALAGRLPEADRTDKVLRVYDYRQATPPQVFYCEMDDLRCDRALGSVKPWQKYWWSIRVVLTDYDDGQA